MKIPLMIAATAIVMATQARAQNAPPVADPSSLPGVEAFVDGIMGTALRATSVPGAVVVIVKDGRIVLKKGYGLANVEQRRPVDPDTSLFRIASMSKLFVATSIMQLVDRGKIDLDAPADRYLEKPLKLRYPKVVTVRNLLTHTAGFEDAYTGIFDAPGKAAPPLQTVIDASLPAQAFPPGRWPAYSNHGFVLLGRIIERVSGETYADYVEKHVMTPLGMACSTAHQPPPPNLKDQVVGAYSVVDGMPKAHPFEVVSASPGGGLSISGADMAKFMLFELGYTPGILSRSRLAQMQSPAFRVSPEMNAIGLGIPLQTLNGRAGLYHTGALDHAASRVTFLPSKHFGIYVALNSDAANGADADVVDEVLDRYFPNTLAPGAKTHPGDLSSYTGAYQTTGSFWVTPPALSAAATQTFVTVAPGGLLRLTHGDTPSLWEPIGGHRFRKIGFDKGKAGDLVFLFKPDAAKPYAMARSNITTRISLRREGVFDIRESRMLLKGAAAGGALVALALIWRAVLALRQRRPGRSAALVGLVFAEAILAHFAVSYGVGNDKFQDGDRLSLTLPPATALLLSEPYVALLVGASSLLAFAWGIRREVSTQKFEVTTVSVWFAMALAVTAFLVAWHLLFL